MCIICRDFGFYDSLSDEVVQRAKVPTPPAPQPYQTLLPAPGASGVGDSFYPGFGNGGYDAQQYTLDLTVTDVATSTLKATTTMTAIATQALSRFNLDFIGFAIDGITVNGQAASFSRDGQELIITPAQPIPVGATFNVAVQYNGAPTPINSVAFPPGVDVPTGWVIFDGGNFVLSEPDGAANFYPVNDHPLDRAAYTFRITLPKPFEVAANGVLEQEIDNGTTTTYVFEARDPMVSYLTTINIYSGFDRQSEVAPNGVLIRNYFAEGVPEELLEPFKQQSAMMDYFSTIFGPYPFELYGSVVVNTETGAALETQTLSIFGLDVLGRVDTEEIVAHELAHQWFGNSLALSDWSDIWLNESFATYSQGLWVEYSQGGATALNGWVRDQYNFIARIFDSISAPGEPPADDLFNPGVYEWGALGLHALRLEIGNTAFFKTLRDYADRFRGQNVTPDDFIEVAEVASGKSLDGLFDRWFYNAALASIPELKLFAGTLGGDRLFGTAAAETLAGLTGDDTLYGNGGADTLIGNAGNDAIYGGAQADTVFGSAGNDKIYGNGGLDTLNGGGGDDLIYGGSQGDRILAGAGNDTIYGNGGGDTIDSGVGLDTVWLGNGQARVVLNPGDGQDVIHGFRLGSTTFQIRGSASSLSFTDTTAGAQILQGTDLLAIVRNQKADTFSKNLNQIFVA